MSAFRDRKFHVGIFAHINMNTLVLKMFIYKYFALICTYPYGSVQVVVVKYGPKRRGDEIAVVCLYGDQIQKF